MVAISGNLVPNANEWTVGFNKNQEQASSHPVLVRTNSEFIIIWQVIITYYYLLYYIPIPVLLIIEYYHLPSPLLSH